MTPRKSSPLEIRTTEVHMCTIEARLDILGQVPFFQDLAPADLGWVNSQFHEEGYEEDEVICHSGEPAKRFYVVAEGRVRLLHNSLTSRDILLDLLTPGEFFGALTG